MRNKNLDMLRGIAVLLVILRHNLGNASLISEFGWLGVDLFFVVSGFLISNNLIHEYKENRNINTLHFILKRSIKIVPSFYFFLLISVLFSYFILHQEISIKKVLNELLFFQSYREGIWFHTWSLSIEVHFYILIFFITKLCIRYNIIENSTIIILSLSLLVILMFGFRLQYSISNKHLHFFSFTYTHLRFDGIIIGILISYLYNFTKIIHFFKKFRTYFSVVGLLLISFGFVFKAGSFIMNTIGLSVVNIGFGILVLLCISNSKNTQNRNTTFLNLIFTTFVFIGFHSYSIYLWHVFPDSIISYLGIESKYNYVITIISSLSLGILMSYCIEQPCMKIRKITVFNNLLTKNKV